MIKLSKIRSTYIIFQRIQRQLRDRLHISPEDIFTESGHQKQRCMYGGEMLNVCWTVYRDHIITYFSSSLLIFLKFTSLCQSSTMVFLQFFTIAILLSITSVKTYSVPYQSIQLAFPITPKLIYTSESNPAFSGYSYTTLDFNGGESNVIFTTGADSASKLKVEINSMKTLEEYSPKNKNQETIMSSEQSKFVKTEENKNKQKLVTNIKVLNKEQNFSKNPEADYNLFEPQTNLQQVSLVDIPYSLLRENLLNFPLFPRYHLSSNIIQSHYNPYADLELPLNNFDFYNPTVPLFYQAATIIPNNDDSKLALTADKNMKASTESQVTKSSQANAIGSESSSTKSSIIESRLNLESTTNAIEETPSSQTAISMKKLESTITSKKNKKITTNESAGSFQNTVEQTTDNTTSSTESTNTETSSLMIKANIATSKRCTRCKK
ncbi:uncharacterized protein LOC114255320 [Monomorium pharaonis]|uniref:uncharacterized protein LOC114255320 n=1 Tax=Monomorium pharaonis TaxID=307658 RepID=UPI00102E14E9|nr:uncharacterized protein LOC114255320 [Monomorium pharaonis]